MSQQQSSLPSSASVMDASPAPASNHYSIAQLLQHTAAAAAATSSSDVPTTVVGTDIDSVMHDSNPIAGPLARSLSIPIFPAAPSSITSSSSTSSGGGSSSHKRKMQSSGANSPSLGSTPTGSSALDIMPHQHKNGHHHSHQQQSSSGATHYRRSSNSSNGSSSSIPSGSLAKRRNSHTPSMLNLSSNATPGGSHLQSAQQAQAATLVSRNKPPCYPGTSNPGTPNYGPLGRSAPIQIGHGNRSGATSQNSSPSQSPALLPMPRSLMPGGPLTPALAPERSIAVSTSHGIVRVRARDLPEHMDQVEEVVLPAQAAPSHGSKKQRSMNGSNTTSHHHRSGSNGHHHHQQTIASPASSASNSVPVEVPSSLPPIVPVKHLVKLSSLSSLASLITAAATAAGDTSGSPSPSSSSPSTPVHSPTTPLSSLRGGVVLPKPIPPTYIILDIDETIHVNAYSPCLMMCERGLEMYQKIISTHANYKTVPYATKSNLTKTLQLALQSKRTVEEKTSQLLNDLQLAAATHNIKIFGLTARFSHMASTTRKELLKLNIDLEKSSPFPLSIRKKMAIANGFVPGQSGIGNMSSPLSGTNGTCTPAERSLTPSPVLTASITPLSSSPMASSMSLPTMTIGASATTHEYYPDVSWTDHPSHGTDAKYCQGVIYTNACEKGPVLQRFLQYLWTKIEQENNEILAKEEQTRRELAALANGSKSGNMNGEQPRSIMTINHAVSRPITIGPQKHTNSAAASSNGVTSAAAAAASSAVASSMTTPSPPDASMSLLAAAGTMTHHQSRKGKRGSASLKSPSPDIPSLLPPSPQASPSPPAAIVDSVTHLPIRVIFIDDRLQNVFSVYESLSATSLFDRFYTNSQNRAHVPHVLEVYTCHYVPPELVHTNGPTNQTKADAAATSAAAASTDHADFERDTRLIEAQIHHFLSTGKIVRDCEQHLLTTTTAAASVTTTTTTIHENGTTQVATTTTATTTTTASASVVHVTTQQQQPHRSLNIPAPKLRSSESMEEDDRMDDVSTASVSSTSISTSTRHSIADDDAIMTATTPRSRPVVVQ